MLLWTILSWIGFGLIAGLIARALVPGKDNIGCTMTIIIGVLGSALGGAIGAALTKGFHKFQPAGLIGSVLGAIVLLVIYNSVTGRKERR